MESCALYVELPQVEPRVELIYKGPVSERTDGIVNSDNSHYNTVKRYSGHWRGFYQLESEKEWTSPCRRISPGHCTAKSSYI